MSPFSTVTESLFFRIYTVGGDDLMEKKTVLMDLDGTLYPWIPDGDWHLEGYYYNLEVVKTMQCLAERLRQEDGIVFRFCTAYPSEHARQEKLDALKRDFGFLDEQEVIFVPYGESKFDYVDCTGDSTICIIDDYSPNLRDAESHGVIGIKAMNGLNGTKGTWQGLRIDIYDPAEENATKIMEILEEGGLFEHGEEKHIIAPGRDGRKISHGQSR